MCQLLRYNCHTLLRWPNHNLLITQPVKAWRQTCLTLGKTRRTSVIVFVLLAAILMLVGITAVSTIDFTNGRRR